MVINHDKHKNIFKGEQMTISEADMDVYRSTPIERSKFSFDQLSNQVDRKDNSERLVAQSELQSMGFRCAPFWDTSNNREGDCYNDYIVSHPDFSLQLREGVVKRLLNAQDFLPKNWEIVIKSGYRPYEVQTHLLRSFIKESKVLNPTWSDAKLLSNARIYVADPKVCCPPHVTGGAVDVEVFNNLTGDYIDMGCQANAGREVAFLFNPNLTRTQKDNRQTLLHAMLEAKFAPVASEWWHFQYGEAYWAAFYGHKATKYDVIGA